MYIHCNRNNHISEHYQEILSTPAQVGMVANDSSDTYDSNKASTPTPATPSKIVQISRWI